MGSPTRVYFVLVALAVLGLFHYTTRPKVVPPLQNVSQQRQAVWAEIVPERPAAHSWSPRHDNQMHFQERLVNEQLEPFPLGRDFVEKGLSAAARGKNRKGQFVNRVTRPHPPKVTATFNADVFEFQRDLELALPQWNLDRLLRYRPHHWMGRGRPTIATYLCSRNTSLQDPYFLATQQLVYRLLWHPRSRSKHYPFTVFVAPFVRQEQREVFAAAGAVVRQLDLVPWNPNVQMWNHLRDMFSKLNMWGQLDFSHIAFLDGDAFPLQNVDDIFTAARWQRCNMQLLPPEDRRDGRHMCDYLFAGAAVAFGNLNEINAGVMVLSPNPHMHERLTRDAERTDEFDNAAAEQSFLNKAFAPKGPFPLQILGHEWNGFLPQDSQEHELRIVHEKLWAFGNRTRWTEHLFEETHDKMLQLYESHDFESMRMRDGLR